MTIDPLLEELRAVIVRTFSELSGGTFTLLTTGWDCWAVDVDDRLIFRFPRDEAAEEALAAEASLLRVIRPRVTMPVPALTLHRGPPLFSCHLKLKGEHLVTAQYDALPNDARQRLATDMALFYAELHGLDARIVESAGAKPIKPWLEADDILRRVAPVLTSDLCAYANQVVREWRQLPPDPYGTTYGFFDGHGWNMAFDHASQRLNGVYDFGDSGFGPLHQEFIYSSFIAPDLTERIVGAYEVSSGRVLDRRRIDLLSGVLRLSELAEFADDPSHAPAMIKNVADWVNALKNWHAR